jgi:hypothetical protein
MQLNTFNPNEITLTHDWYVNGAGLLSNEPMMPQPRIMSQANRLRGDITSAITLIQVCTGRTPESQKEMKLMAVRKFFRWYYSGCNLEEIDRAVYSRPVVNMWLAEWGRRELELMVDVAQKHSSLMSEYITRKYRLPKERIRRLVQQYVDEYWLQLHTDRIYDMEGKDYNSIVNQINILTNG